MGHISSITPQHTGNCIFIGNDGITIIIILLYYIIVICFKGQAFFCVFFLHSQESIVEECCGEIGEVKGQW